jgi:hypothetical protein
VSWTEQMNTSKAFQLLDSELRMPAKSTALQIAGKSTISYRMITGSTTD